MCKIEQFSSADCRTMRALANALPQGQLKVRSKETHRFRTPSENLEI